MRVTELNRSEVETVDRHLPLNRLCQQVEERSTYLIAWEDAQPVGHAHIAWCGTHLGVAELQDVFVLPERRRQGIATDSRTPLKRRLARAGATAISLSVGQEGNAAARLLIRIPRRHARGLRAAGLRPLLGLSVELVLPAHGAPTGRADLERALSAHSV